MRLPVSSNAVTALLKPTWLGVVLCLVLLPAVAHAQASIAGTVRDSSGAVLPGVTIEAASDVLIEKVRVTVADGSGRFQLIDLRPGAYVVTFTLTGFNTFRRSGVMLVGGNTVVVDAEMRVGALEETITVTGEAPVVDVQTTTRQSVLSADVIDALPTARNYVTLARLIPGTQGGGNDVGGSSPQGTGGSVTIHGSKNTDQRVTLNGINTMTLQAGGNIGGQIPDVGSAAEITVDTTSLGADLATGGVRINFVPRDGGNRLANSSFFTFANESLQGSNYTEELRVAGLATPNAINYNYDLNQSFGGPMRRDKVWFWFSFRRNRISNYAAVFENRNAFNPNAWTYEPDESKRGQNEARTLNSSLRLTWQASPKHKIAGTYKADRWCQCPNGISATRSPETAVEFRFPRLRQEHIEWTSPMTNRVLLEAVAMHLFERWGNMHLQPGGSLKDEDRVAIQPQMISVTEQSTNMTYRTFTSFNNTEVPNFAYRAAMSYVTGTHNFKVGFNRTHGFLDVNNYSLNPIAYRFNNGIPNQITMRAFPARQKSDLNNDLGLFAQDRVTLNRMTMGLAIRFDYFETSFPDQTLGPVPLAPTRNASFPGFQNLAWKDLSYRSSVSYDVFGTGRTALKMAANKYLLGQTLNGIASSPNPIGNLVNSTTRNWTDDGDFVPECDLLNPAANGECQGMSNTNFGTVVQGATFDDDLTKGWGTRPSNWEFSVGVQHEIMPRVSVDVGWYRRIWQNFQVTDNLAVSASDFDTFDVRVPTDPRLANSGALLVGLRNLKPESFGRPSQNYNTKAEKFGKQQEHWNGFDVAMNARLQNGLTMQIGTSTGRTTTDECAVRAALPELNLTSPRNRCREVDPFQTDVKGYAVYTVPRAEVQVSGTFRSTAPSSYNASFTMNNAYLAANSTLGRPLSAGGNANISVDLLEPNTAWGERRNELDLRFGKVVRLGRARSVLSFDLYNALNNNSVLDRNETFTLTAAWPRPTSILNARLAKFSVQFDF